MLRKSISTDGQYCNFSGVLFFVTQNSPKFCNIKKTRMIGHSLWSLLYPYVIIFLVLVRCFEHFRFTINFLMVVASFLILFHRQKNYFINLIFYHSFNNKMFVVPPKNILYLVFSSIFRFTFVLITIFISPLTSISS